MKRNIKSLLVLLTLGLFLSCARAPQQLVSEKPVAPVVDLTSEKVRDSIVLIESENASGTGFFIAPGMVATNTHVVAHIGSVSIKSPDKEKDWTIEGVVGFDAENSLVILKLTGEGTPLPLGDSDTVQIGESVSIFSYPDGAFKVLESRIQSLRKSNRRLRLNTTTAKKTNGSPVFNNKGQVIGVIVPYGGYAISSSVLATLLAESTPMEPLAEWQQRKHIRAAAYYGLGKEKFRVKDYAGAIVDFDKVIELDPGDVRAYYERGRAQDRLGDHDSAIVSCTQVLKMDPGEADAYYARGSIKARRGDYTEAIIDLDKAIELDVQHADAYSNRGGVKFLLGKSEEANGNAEKAQSLYKAAIADCNKAIEIDPEDADTYNFRGSAKTNLDDFEGAILDFNRAIQIDAADATIYNNRGSAKFKLGESADASGKAKEAQRLYEAAIEDYTQSIKIDPDDLTYNNRGLTKTALGELESAHGNPEKTEGLYESAIADYTQAIKINPKYADAYENRATAKCKLGDIESARGEKEKAQGLYHEGITDYDKSIQLNNQEDTDAKTANLDSEIGRNSIVLVLAWSGLSNKFFSGSGFFVDRNKIVTNIHVVDLPGPIFAKRSDKETTWSIERVITFDVENDLVILELAGEGVPLPLGDSDVVKSNEDVIVVGYPKKKYTVAQGTIHSIRNSDKWIRVNIDTDNGSSGSPILNSRKQVIGVSVSRVNLEDEVYALAIPSNTLKALLAPPESTEPLIEWYNRDHIRAYVYASQGKEKLEANFYDEAITNFDKAIELNPKNSIFYYNRGRAKSASGKDKAAIADYDTAIQLNSGAVYVYIARGNAKQALGDYEGAIADLDRITQLYPEHADLYNIRGVWNANSGDFKEAIFDFSRAIEINPGHADAYKERAHAKFKLAESKTGQGDITGTLQLYQSAMEDCTQAIWLTPKDADVYDNRGWAYFHLGKAETDRGHIEKAADLYEKAIEDYTQAIKLNVEHPHAYRNRANAKFRLGNYEAVIIDLDKAIEMNPKNAKYYYDRGRAKEVLGQKEAAKADFQKARELDPDVGK